MKPIQTILAFSLILSLTACADKSSKEADSAQEAHTEHDTHAAHTEHSQEKQALPAVKFPVDATLKGYMDEILETMNHVEQSDQTPAETGEIIQINVQNIFKACKLEPEADAAIHPILASLLAGAKLLSQNQKEAGHEKVNQALLTYQQFFDHPETAPLKAD